MDDSQSGRLVELTVATFHTTIFFLGFVLVLFSSGILGPLLASLNTLVGVAIFVVSWFMIWVFTRAVLKGTAASLAERHTPAVRVRRLFFPGAFWGAVNGLSFLVLSGLIFVLVLVTASNTPFSIDTLEQAPVVLFYVLVTGSIPAILVGAAFGLVFGTADLLALQLARLVFKVIDVGSGVVRAE